MSNIALFELLAAICALLAAVFIFDQHLHRARPYKLMWALGLLFYGIAAGAAFLGDWMAWSTPLYETWYYFGGVLTAAYLGLGSLYLLGPRRLAHALTILAILVSLYAAVRIALLPVSAEITSQHADAKNIFPLDVRLCAVVMNIAGSILLFGGALWSAWSFFRRHAPGYRLISMGLIALGAVFPAVSTGLQYGLQALGVSVSASLGEFLGALCLFLGLLISLDAFTALRVPFTGIVLYERKRAAEPAPR